MPKTREWETVVEKPCPEGLLTTADIRNWLNAWIKERDCSGPVKKIEVEENGHWIAYGFCNKEKKCKQSWRFASCLLSQMEVLHAFLGNDDFDYGYKIEPEFCSFF